MGLSIKHLLLLLFFTTLAAIFFLKPHKVGTIEKKGIPQIMFLDFKSYQISEEGVESIGRGLMAEKFGPVMKVKAPYFRRLTPHGVETIEAKEGVYTENRSLLFSRDVRLSREDGWRIATNRVFYDLKKGIYTTQGAPFVAHYGRSVVEGKNMVYYQKSGKIRADSIKANIVNEDI
ncbi:hypothetical protein [Hydrogenimonas sp.]